MTKIKLTPNQIKHMALTKKMKEDTAWYMENFLKIRNKQAKLVPFKLNEAQTIFNGIIEEQERLGKPHRYIILKARQMGLSTYTEGLIYKRTSQDMFINSMIIAHEDKATQNLFNMSKLYYEESPEAFRPMKKYSNEKALVFENPTNKDEEKRANPGLRSRITVSTAGTAEAGRSATIHNLHVSELAFFPNPETTMTALLQSVPDTNSSLVIIESTANGVGDYFHRMWLKAVRGESDFVPVFLPWFTDSTYKSGFTTEAERNQFIAEVKQTFVDNSGNEVHTDEYELMVKFNLTYEQLKWRRETIANKCNGELDIFKQEYPSTAEEAFISSGRPKFNTTAVQKYGTMVRKGDRGYLERVGEHVRFVKDPKGYVEVWEEPQPGKEYCIGADVAEGLITGDYSTAFVGGYDFDVKAMWRGHIDPDLYGEELDKLARWYNGAYLGVENNNHGLTTLKELQRLEYWNIYYQKVYDRLSDELTVKMGWNTNRKTKPLMIDKMAEYIREMYLTAYSDVLVNEMATYVINDNGSTSAQQGCYDDSVMAMAILIQLILEGVGEDYEPENTNNNARRRKKKIEEVIDPLFEEEEREIAK